MHQMKFCFLLIPVGLTLVSGCHKQNHDPVSEPVSQMIENGDAPLGPLNLYYEIHGADGIPLILIHGGGSTIQTTFGNCNEHNCPTCLASGI